MMAAQRAAAIDALASEPDDEASNVFNLQSVTARRGAREEIFERLAKPTSRSRHGGCDDVDPEDKELSFQPAVSKRAQNRKEPEDVFKRLWNKSKSQQKLREQQQKDKEEEESSLVRAQPKLNRSRPQVATESESAATVDKVDVKKFAKRMERYNQEKQEHLKLKRLQREAAKERAPAHAAHLAL